MIHDNLDLGRPKNVQLIFDRRIQKNTPSRFRTRVMTKVWFPVCGWTTNRPRSSSILSKAAACATETTVNNTRRF